MVFRDLIMFSVTLNGSVILTPKGRRAYTGDAIQQAPFVNRSLIVATKKSFQSTKSFDFEFQLSEDKELYGTYYGNYIRK